MTVSNTTRKAGPYTGNGVTTSFAFSFKVFVKQDISVVLTNTTTGVSTTLVLDSDYSVSVNANQDTSPGGTITYPISGSPLPATSTLTVIGNMAYSQGTQLPAGGAYNAQNVEDALDRVTILTQQLVESFARALSLPVGSTASSALPAPSANALLGWDASAAALVNVAPTSLITIAGSSGFSTQTFSGTGAQTTFTLNENPGALPNLEVYISGVRQTPTADYTVSGTTLTFVAAPPAGSSNILVRWGQTYTINSPADSSVTPAKLSFGGPIWTTNYNTAIGGSTVSGTDSKFFLYGGGISLMSAHGLAFNAYNLAGWKFGISFAPAASFWPDGSGAYIFQSTGATTGTAGGAATMAERFRIDATGNGRAGVDNAYTWGASGARWSAIWAANGTIQTSDARTKTDVADAALGCDFIMSLRPVSYKWIVGGNDVSTEGGEVVITPQPGVRTHWGFIAQEVKTAADAAGVDFGGWVLSDKDNPESEQALRYDQFVAPMVKAIQELKAELDAAKARIAALEA